MTGKQFELIRRQSVTGITKNRNAIMVTISEKVKQASSGIKAYKVLKEEFEASKTGMEKIEVAHKIIDSRAEKNPVQKIIGQIESLLADFDKKYLISLIDSITFRRAAGKSIQRSDFSTNGYGSASSRYYSAYFEAVGGKEWYELLQFSNSVIEEKLTKKEAAKVKARNEKFAVKLKDAGVTSIENFETAYSQDGFNGVWKVDTNKGRKTVTLNVIFAGGYHIQCAHYRVLVNVK